MKINRCQPGFGASCSFCCGSHNYPFPPHKIEELFISRGEKISGLQVRHPEESCDAKLVSAGMQCSNICILESEPGIVCCSVYFDEDKQGRIGSYFTGTCKGFLCDAWIDLTDRQVLFAAALMKEWYYYSLLIKSPEILMDLCAEYDDPDDVPGGVLEELKIELADSLFEDDLI